MLKIKDNVNLKKLEKFGFEKRYDTKNGKINKYVYAEDTRIEIHCNKRYIEFNDYLEEMNLNIYSDAVYELSKANLVEKIPEEK